MKYCPLCTAPLSPCVREGVQRLACSAECCDFVHWDNPVPVVAALVQYRGGVLLARNVAWPAGRFSLITGFLEKGEAPEQAALREVEEELGLAARLNGFIGYYPFYPQNQLILAFDVAAEGEVVLNSELAEYRVIAADRLRPWDFGTGLAVRDWLAGRT
jgi:NADH pyrophosphatase NudC (nudix superfamily)